MGKINMQQQNKDAYQQLLASIHRDDMGHHLHPFTDPKTMSENPPFVIEKGEGCYVEGQGIRLFDAMSGLGCVNIGYGRKEMAEAAKQAMNEICYYQSFAATTTAPPSKLAAKIASLLPAGYERMFFANSGSEANETLLKMIRLYWQAKKQPWRKLIISRDYAYHGSTIATSVLNGRREMIDGFGLDDSDVIHTMSPYWYRNAGSMTPAEFGKHAALEMENAIKKAGPKNVAAIFVEPIQGTGGAIIPPETYFPEINRIAKEYDILLISDEVLTGLGRAGAWSATALMGIDADMISMSKGVASGYAPISAAIIHDRVFDVISKVSGVLQHGFTSSSHPVSCWLALKNIEILENEKLVDHAGGKRGAYFAEKMSLLESHPLVGEVRTCGMICGIEVVKNKQKREHFPVEFHIDEHIAQAALFKGIIIRPTGNSLVLCPPMIMNEGEIDFVAQATYEALDDILGRLRQEKLID